MGNTQGLRRICTGCFYEGIEHGICSLHSGGSDISLVRDFFQGIGSLILHIPKRLGILRVCRPHLGGCLYAPYCKIFQFVYRRPDTIGNQITDGICRHQVPKLHDLLSGRFRAVGEVVHGIVCALQLLFRILQLFFQVRYRSGRVIHDAFQAGGLRGVFSILGRSFFHGIFQELQLVPLIGNHLFKLLPLGGQAAHLVTVGLKLCCNRLGFGL